MNSNRPHVLLRRTLGLTLVAAILMLLWIGMSATTSQAVEINTWTRTPTATATRTTVPTNFCPAGLLTNPSFEIVNGSGFPTGWTLESGSASTTDYLPDEPDGARIGYAGYSGG